MTAEYFADYFRKMVTFYEGQVKFWSDQIEYYNKSLKRYRKEDREIVEYVWSKGPLTEQDMRIFGKDFKGKDTEMYLMMRRRAYGARKSDIESLENARKQLAYYTKGGAQ